MKGALIQRYRWSHVVVHVLFDIHSPSRIYLGTCWCQRKRK